MKMGRGRQSHAQPPVRKLLRPCSFMFVYCSQRCVMNIPARSDVVVVVDDDDDADVVLLQPTLRNEHAGQIFHDRRYIIS